MKKIFNLMLVAVLTLVSFMPAVSAVTNKNGDVLKTDGTIKVTGTSEGKTYDVYQILVLESYADVDGTAGMGEDDAYVYRISEVAGNKWAAFINDSTKGGKYLSVSSKGDVSWKKGTDESDKADFAKEALKYAKDNGIAATATMTGNGEDITFTGLEYGYYLVDSSVGALCGLTTTKPNAEVIEKNSDPTVTKLVSEKGEFESENTAFIGETVYFQTTINVGLGAENYVLTDTMSEGLTLNKNNIVVKQGTATLEKDTDYTLEFDKNGATFVITFTKEDLAEDKDIVVTYEAVVNENAVVGPTGNGNSTTLKYGSDESLTSTTTTYTYGFDLVKTDDNHNKLDGAEFKLYDLNDKEIFVELVEEGLYRVSHTATSGDVIQAGKVRIEGLDAGSYKLVETKNPDGYTRLLEPREFTIEDDNLDAEMDGDAYVSGGIEVVNTKGNLLPETGGIGTTIFIVIGSLMVTLFGLLLVTKYRMSKMDV